jgi:hypothetical protein
VLSEARALPEARGSGISPKPPRFTPGPAHLGRESQNYDAEISFIAPRKAGEILTQLEKSDGGTPGRKTHDSVSSVSKYRQTVQVTDTSVRTARWQELAMQRLGILPSQDMLIGAP